MKKKEVLLPLPDGLTQMGLEQAQFPGKDPD
jgi:hypothetical protein